MAKEFGALLGLAVLCLLLTVLTRGTFLRFTNLMNILRATSLIAIVASGMTLVIISGGIDLSVGSVLSFASCITAGMIVNHHINIWLSILAGLGLGALMGLVNGLMVTKVHLPPFIATLGMMGVARGLAFVYTGGAPIYTFPDAYRFLGNGMIGPFPFPALLMFLIFILTHVLLTQTKIGRYAYAIGGNEEAAILSGIPIDKYKMYVYIMTGVLSALAGIILAARLDAATSVAGDGFELDVIAAVVIGGTSLSGGEGGVFGSLIGALIMGVVRNGLNLLVVSSNWQRVILGCIILGAVALDVWRRTARQRARR